MPSSSVDDPLFNAQAEWKGKRHVCPWNGRVWPMTNSHVIEALGRWADASRPALRSAAAHLLQRFVHMMFHDGNLERPNCYEHYNPNTGAASVYRGINDVRIETVPVPEIGPGEVLVKIHTCGICGTDLKKIHTGSHSAPRVFGHEMAGTVAAIGEGVTDLKLGDRVMAYHHIPCGECYYCRKHTFAQCETYKKVVKMTFAKGASLADPAGLFNSSLEGNVRRAIDFHEGAAIDEAALTALIRAAVALNTARAR